MAEARGQEQGAELAQAFQRALSVRGDRPAKRKTPPPFSLRLTAEERARLDQDAGNVSLGAYIRSRLFDGAVPARRSPRRVVHDDQVLAQLLGSLGQSRIANNLNQLARAVNTGSLFLPPEDVAGLREACAAVTAMRRALMQALGLERGDQP